MQIYSSRTSGFEKKKTTFKLSLSANNFLFQLYISPPKKFLRRGRGDREINRV